MRVKQVLLGILLLLTPSALRAEEASASSWTPCGWGGGGFYWAAAFHPARSGVIYMGGDVAGVYKSEDHGLHWRLINNGLVDYGVFSLAADRTHAETVYAATAGGLCKSIDGGEHWRLLPHTAPQELRITGEKGSSIRAIAVDPTDGNVIYAGTPGGRVYKSADGGQTWRVVWGDERVAGPRGGAVYSVAVAAKEPSLVLAATSGLGLVLSRDAGQTWAELKTPKKASCAAVAPSDPNVIYGSFFSDGIWKSTDKGKTWVSVAKGPAQNVSVLEVAVDPGNPLAVYAIGTAKQKEWDGFFLRSFDGGETWQESSTMTTDTGGDPTLPGDPTPRRLSTPTNLAVSPTNPKELFVSANWRPCLSEDGGRTWTERARGADISCVYDIRFHKGRTYVAAMDEGIFVSEDNGKSWRQSWPLKYDPQFSGHYWRLAITDKHGVDRIISTSSPWNDAPNRIVLSEDGGKTYKAATSGLPDYVPRANTMWGRSYPRALAVDPRNPERVYLGLDGDPEDGKKGGGLFQSEDGGKTWKQLPNQPGSRRAFFGLAVDPTDSRRLYWAACGERGGLYKSEDAGDSWQCVFSSETWLFNVLATSEGVVYCPGVNLWRSADQGRTWAQLTHFQHGRQIVGLEVDPRDPKTLWISSTNWAGDSDGAVHKTRDGGATWQEITGNLPFRKPLVLRFNPETKELWAGGVTLFKIKQ